MEDGRAGDAVHKITEVEAGAGPALSSDQAGQGQGGGQGGLGGTGWGDPEHRRTRGYTYSYFNEGFN